MTKRKILLRFHEIALKGGNRGWFEELLAGNAKRLIRNELGDDYKVRFKRVNGRVFLELKEPSEESEWTGWHDSLPSILGRLFGLSSFSPIRLVETDKEVIAQACLEEFQTYLQSNPLPKTFRVRTRRSDKVFSETSPELDRYFGSFIKRHYPQLEVQLKTAECTLGIEIHKNETYVWSTQFQGQGGLPVGGNGLLLSLMSGGLDSPVAAIQALRRGSPTAFIHFYGTPFVGEESLEKVKDLVRKVNQYQPTPQPLYVISFGKIQEKIALATPAKYRTVLYRRMMIRIANRVAQQINALALITGESLGQVASQTLENLSTIDHVAEMPILRPLITYDKDEIIRQAHHWGTFETSVRPSLDCCTLFADHHPSLRTSRKEAEQLETLFSVEELVNEGLDGMVVV